MTDGPYGTEPYPGHTPTPPGYPPAGSYPSGNYPAPPPPGYAAYPPPGYGAPGYAPPPGPGFGRPPRNGLGTASLVLGIIGIVFCWIPFTGWALNILAVIFGALGMGRAKRGEATNRSSAVAGLVLGSIGLAVWVVIVIVAVATVGSVNMYFTS